MENDCATVGLNENEVELELGLSLGSTFKRAEKLKPIKKEAAHDQQHASDAKPSRVDTDLRDDKPSFVRDVAPQGSPVLDPQTKREFHALKRQEAKKKRAQKQQKQGRRRAKNGGCSFNDVDVEERESKKNKVEDYGSETYEVKNVNLNLSIKQNMDQNVCSNPGRPTAPVLPVQHQPCPTSQCAPFTMWLARPCDNKMRSWATAKGANERNVVQPVANRSFRPYHAGQDSTLNVANGYGAERNCGKEGESSQAASNWSPISSSSLVSDHQSSSLHIGSSSDTGTHSSSSKSEQPVVNGSVTSNTTAQSEPRASSYQMESAQSIDKSTIGINRAVSLKVPMSSPSLPEQEAILETQPALSSKSINDNSASSPTPTTETNGDVGKPPKLQTQQQITQLPHMPCVSTTGNGPNGKTVNGFLYRYTKSEISIICVCHGSSFSPVEFVKHAGGTDLSQPLKHITVIPSACT